MKILVTGFDPFGKETINPAWQAVSRLPSKISGAEIVPIKLPTVFRTSLIETLSAVQQHSPDAIVCVGQAGGRSGITVERVAINIEDAPLPDNAGVQPVDRPVTTEGPAAYFSTLPIKAMVREIREYGIEASISNSAGTFVCNHLMYGILHYLATTAKDTNDRSPEFHSIRAGFIHVPYTPQQAAQHQLVANNTSTADAETDGHGPVTSTFASQQVPSMEVDEVIRGLTLAISAIVENATDDIRAEGTVH